MVSTRAEGRSYKLWSSRRISHEIYSNYSFFFTVYHTSFLKCELNNLIWRLNNLCEGLSVQCVFWWENRAQTFEKFKRATSYVPPTEFIWRKFLSDEGHLAFKTSRSGRMDHSPTLHIWANLNCLNGDRAGASYRKRSRSIARKKFSSEQKNEEWENTKWSFLFLRIVSFVYV